MPYAFYLVFESIFFAFFFFFKKKKKQVSGKNLWK